MAVPNFGPGENFAGALSITGPVTRFNRDAADRAAKTLLTVAVDLDAGAPRRIPYSPG